MASSNVCWGVEVGAGALKALKIARDGESLRVLEFVEVPHARPLSSPDVDEAEAIRVAVGTLASQHAMTGDAIAISAPGQAGFVRFAKLPPTEPKQVANVVKFEAAQQIPFPLEDVEWAYQTFVGEDDPDIEVGIFAITRERVMERLAVWEELKLEPGMLALSPLAAFNAIAFDRDFSDETPGTVIIDIGTTATDLIVVDSGRVWIRTFPMGGHNFTEALVSTFKIDYGKAERLKKEAERRKEKRHIFQAMKPVISDFAQDVQRSLAYYKQLHPESELTRVIGLGSTFRLLGLRKFLSASLQMEVERCERFNKLSVDGPEASDFQSSALNFATAYGLALQGLGLASIDANLVPTSVVRAAVWRKKTPWVATAAVVSLLAGAAGFLRPTMDQQAVDTAKNSPQMARVDAAKRQGNQQKRAWEEVAGATTIGYRAENVRRLLDRRELIPAVLTDVRQMLASGAQEPGDPVGAAPDQWRGLSLRSMTTEYLAPGGAAATGPAASPSGPEAGSGSGSSRQRNSRRGRGEDAGFGGGGRSSGGADSGTLVVTLEIDSTNAGQRAFFDSTVLAWLRENAEREDAPYTYTVPGIDDITMTTVQVGRVPAPEPEDGSAQGDQRASGSAGSSGAADSGVLRSLAPLPEIGGPFPPEATVQRFRLRLEAKLKGAAATRFAAADETGRAEAGAS